MSLHYASGGLYAADWASLLLQDDEMEPGDLHSLHGALLPLLESLQWKGNAHQLAEMLGGLPRTLGMQEFRNILAELGYITTLTHSHSKHITEAGLPCLFVPDAADHAPLLVTEGMQVRNLRTRAQQDVLELEPGSILRVEAFDAFDHSPAANRWFTTTLRRFRGLFRQVLLLGVLINGLSLGVPFFSMMVYDHVIGAHDLRALVFLLFGVAIAFGAETIFRLVRASALAWFGARVNFLAAQAVFERLLAIEPLLVEQASPAAQVARIKTFESVREFFSGQAFLLFVEMPFLLLLLAALALLSPMMALVSMGVGVCFAVMVALQLRSIRLVSQRSARALSERQRDALELVTKLQSLRLCGLEHVLLRRLIGTTKKSLRRGADVTHRLKRVEHVASSMTLLGGLLAISLGVQDVWAGELSPGGLIAGMILVWRILSPMQQLSTVAPRLEQVQGGIQQIEKLLVLPVERAMHSPLARSYDFNGEIEIVNVAMRYPRQLDPVFSGMSLMIKPGEVVAIVGGNGSGKSSLLKLMNGLYRPAAGAIRVDGVDVRQFDALSLRRSMTYVAQTADLFSGTLHENMTMAAPFASDDDIRQALMRAGAFEDVMDLPQGLETVIGTEAADLPPMLPYTLSLARAYLSLKKVVLFDELPYAVLASHAGMQFKKTIQQIRGTHTVLMVTHTADLIALADTVIYLQQEQRPRIMRPEEAVEQMREMVYGV